jgi:putative tryptophan/tyrosine transport system substrate-binding protein
MMRGTATILAILVLGVLVSPFGADAEQAGKVYRVGYLGPSTKEDWVARTATLVQALRALGYVEGQNLVIECRWAEGKSERYRSLVAELVQRKVDVIVTTSTATIKAAKETTKTVPIVMAGGSGVLEAGLIDSLARPGGNITGVVSGNVELIGKRFELLMEMVPGVSRVAVIGLAGHASTPVSLKDAEDTSRALGLLLQPLLVRGVAELERAFASATQERAGALLMLSGPMASGESSGTRIADLAMKTRLPSISPFPGYVRQGGLMAYGLDVNILHRHAAVFVDKILKGANPADLPVEQPTKLELAINLRTAKVIGLAIPPSVLMRADEVIE